MPVRTRGSAFLLSFTDILLSKGRALFIDDASQKQALILICNPDNRLGRELCGSKLKFEVQGARPTPLVGVRGGAARDDINWQAAIGA
jgi:hypothetical protein